MKDKKKRNGNRKEQTNKQINEQKMKVANEKRN